MNLPLVLANFHAFAVHAGKVAGGPCLAEVGAIPGQFAVVGAQFAAILADFTGVGVGPRRGGERG
jgi:hypothetical protein